MKINNNKSTSVVVVTYQTGSALWICLYRILQFKNLHEIIVVNNGNEHDVEVHLRKLENKHPSFKYVTGHGNVGFARACNLGVKNATGKYVLLLNPDAVLLEEDALNAMTELFEQDGLKPPVALVGGILRNEDGTEQRASRRNFITPKNAIMEGLGLHNIRVIPYKRINIHDRRLPKEPVAIDAISGACMAMERERYEMMGGLDEEYFLHVEDMDICRRVKNAGGSAWIHPDVNILHYRSTSQVNSVFVERMKTKGFYRYFSLHHHKNYIWRAVINVVITLRLAGKITGSFADDNRPMPMITDAVGLRRVQSIIRGVEASILAIRNKVPSPLPAGSTVLVTGASSAVGLFAIGRLLAHGCKVIALKHNTLLGFFHPNLTWIEGDLTTPEKLSASLQGLKCEYALHCAPIWHTHDLAKALKPAGVRRIVAISSTSLHSKAKSSSMKERKTAKRLVKGEQMLMSEAQELGVEWTIIRPTLIYGAGLDQNISRIAGVIDEKRKFVLPKDAQGLRAPVHADDVALAAINALGVPVAANKHYYLQGGTVLPYHDMVVKVFEAMRVKPKIRAIANLHQLCGILHGFMPNKVPHPAVALRMQDNLVFDDSAAKTELGIAPREFLTDGIYDLGVCEEDMFRSLLPV
ncbi:MAG: glycosyltransferase [Alphaproteobacteria bacterium]|nr:glycosyltransferase [Alphaproteobacteria bacterium]